MVKDDDDKPDTKDDEHSLDMSQAAVKKMISTAKTRGYITLDELNQVMPSEQVTSEHAVAFTIFLACPPDDPPTGSQSETSTPDAGVVPSCYLLRLSILDQPLR